MRKALAVGIDYYESGTQLYGCVNDAHAVKAALDRHSDGSINFDVKLLTGTGPSNPVSNSLLREQIRLLFDGDSDIALLFFAGHGHIESTGGYLLCSDSRTGFEGLPISEIMTYANSSRARNRIIILDSCHAGIAGTHPTNSQQTELSEGITILTASTADQYASEENGSGVFTSLLVDALNGSAANLVGDVTPGSVYAHVDQSLGPWEQRPVFKTNVKGFVSLRRVSPPVDLADLRRISEFFPSPGHEYQLDPSYEPRSDAPDMENTAKFAILQQFNRTNLVVPVNAPHMYDAAMESRSCRLTALGEHYRKLAARKRI